MAGNVLQANGSPLLRGDKPRVLINPALSLWESRVKKLKNIVFLGSPQRLAMWVSNYWLCSVCEVAACTSEPFWSGVWSHWGRWLFGIDVTEQSLGGHVSSFLCCAKVCGFCRTTGISHLAAGSKNVLWYYCCVSWDTAHTWRAFSIFKSVCHVWIACDGNCK